VAHLIGFCYRIKNPALAFFLRFTERYGLSSEGWGGGAFGAAAPPKTKPYTQRWHLAVIICF